MAAPVDGGGSFDGGFDGGSGGPILFFLSVSLSSWVLYWFPEGRCSFIRWRLQRWSALVYFSFWVCMPVVSLVGGLSSLLLVHRRRSPAYFDEGFG